MLIVLAAGCTTPLPGDGELQGSMPRLVGFSLGPDAATSPYVSSVTLGDDGASFAASLHAVTEATTRMGALVHLENTGERAQSVALSGPRVEDPRVTGARLLVGEATLDLLARDPQVLLHLPAGTRVDVGIEITVGSSGAGQALPTWSVRLDVSGS